MLNLILATNPVILSLLSALWLWSLTGYFFICPKDLLICSCSSELHKLFTSPTLYAELLQTSLCSLSHTQWENCKRTVLFTQIFFFTSSHDLLFLFTNALCLWSPQSCLFLFLRFRGFVSFTFSCRLREQNHILWTDSGLKQFTPVSSSLSVICCHLYPAISVFLSPVGFFSLFVLSWCTRSSIEELIWTTNNFILFHVKQASLAVPFHSTIDDLLQQHERTIESLILMRE